ncbi:YoaK family protein [Streptomyces tirandamycinicus]|uniref:YoaK family protein n=1 Tax=Streptomyces tirandamycinicus TaxID=2174846 RepID=UPI0003626D3E
MQAKRVTFLTWAMMALTVTTGMVEAVSFLALGPVFTAVQTGTMLLLSFALVGVAGLAVVPCLASVAGFTVGAALSARFESRSRLKGHRWFREALIAESLVLAVAASVAWGIERPGEPLTAHHYTAAGLVALAMGIRNVSTLRAGVRGMPVTVTTRALAALIGGSPLAVDTRLAPGAGDQVRRAVSVLAMFAGGLLGAWLLHDGRIGAGAVLLCTAVLGVAVALAFTLVPRERTSEAG